MMTPLTQVVTIVNQPDDDLALLPTNHQDETETVIVKGTAHTLIATIAGMIAVTEIETGTGTATATGGVDAGMIGRR